MPQRRNEAPGWLDPVTEGQEREMMFSVAAIWWDRSGTSFSFTSRAKVWKAVRAFRD
jgi:hypothetical protein